MLNTGMVESEPRGNASEEVLRVLAPMYEPGSYPLPVIGYRAEVIAVPAGAFCLVVNEQLELPLLMVAVAEDRMAAEQLWPELVRFYEIVKSWKGIAPVSTSSLVEPPSVPWYASMEIYSDPGEAELLRDFSRHFAWGWIDYQRWRWMWSRRQRFS